ncbi:hypothetical protein D9757_013790 [Collybiopsis confluens]|uniref:Uncharacterized protein n=1 Tax=Collybiopsis confluens TaxID=2823264 RepID=A0A8H5FQI1_9AGAR|nr:hypothetical protein D9757_013790 [Collybiopsis confluens]
MNIRLRKTFLNDWIGGYHVDMIGIYIMRSSADVKGKLKDGTDARGTTIICYCPPQKYPRSVKSIVDWTKDIIIDPEWKYPNVGFDTDPLLPVLPILWYTLYSWWDLLQYLFQNISHLERILLQDPNVEDTRQLNKIRLDLQSYLLIFNDYNDIIQYLLGIAKAQTSTIDPLQRNSYNFSSVANLGTPPSTPTGPAPRTPGAYKPSPLAAPPLVVSPPPTPSTMTNPLRIQTGFKLGPLPMTPSTPRGTSTVETHHHQRRNSRGQTSSYFQLQPDLSQLHSNSNGVQEEKATNAQTTRPPPPNSRQHFYTDLSSLVDKIIKEAQILGSRIDSARTMVFSDVAIRESITMRQLSYIAVLYLPATFSAGIFGMNVQQITTSTLDQFLAVALSFSAATIWIFVAIILHGSTMARILWPLYYSRYFIFDVLLVYALERWSWAAQKVADWRREKSSTDPPDYRPERSPSSPSEFEIKVETPSAEAREEQWVPEFRTPVFGKE